MSSSLLSLSGQVDQRELIPEDWTCNQLGSTCEVFGGGKLGFTKERHYQGSGVTAFSAAGPDGFVEKAEITDRDGVVLSAIGANCGRCFFASGNWTTLANVQAIIPRNGLDARYLFYFINRDGYWDRSGSAQPFIKPSSVHASWVAYPKAEAEQSKIAEVLSTVDRAIEQSETLIAKQQRIKTGLMQDLLTRGIDEHGNRRSEQTHEFKDSPLGRIPMEWEVITLGAMLKCARGYLQTGPFGSQLHAHEYVHEGTPVIMPQDILNGQISTSVIARIPERRANELHRHRLLPNDIVFSRRGDLSRAAGIGEREAGWICGTGCFLLRVSPDAIDSTWLANVYRHHHVQRQVETNAVGSTMPSLNNAVMENLLIAFPKADEQQEIMRRCDAAADGIASTFDQLAKMRALKRGLMQDLLTGNRRVTALLEQREGVTT